MKKITIRGACLDEEDSPVAGARVRIFRYPSRVDAPLLVADLRTGEDGKFVAPDVETAGGAAEPFLPANDLCVLDPSMG